ncbi:hypothetical protein COS66_01675 [Candidatus Berkelbacteria bacterium CG06_land_8_20_14_3_00_43_10]|nr:MAG: hypothetical protein COS66_01675 [Candidatus Berkelbacteria bacterium CG06_land_8_20_14_3_00_43_10]
MQKKQEAVAKSKRVKASESAGVITKETPQKVDGAVQTAQVVVAKKAEAPKQASTPAVVVLGSKQFVVKGGEELIVEKLSHKDGDIFVTEDILHGKKVTCTVAGPVAGPKIDILKFKNKTRYLRHMGHRQKYTKVIVTSIA